ncbi:MAG: hypothetical protein K8T90_12685 [Planctomycetes bacterium]|nr:hypothetical protein [Planctomycetota bacterium]
MRGIVVVFVILATIGTAFAQDASPPSPRQANPAPAQAGPNVPPRQGGQVTGSSQPASPPAAAVPVATSSSTTGGSNAGASPPVPPKPTAIPAPASKPSATLQSPTIAVFITVGLLVVVLAIGAVWLRRALRAATTCGEAQIKAFRSAETTARAKFVADVKSLAVRPGQAIVPFKDHRAAVGFAVEYSPGECETAINANTDAVRRHLISMFIPAAVAATAVAVVVLVALA